MQVYKYQNILKQVHNYRDKSGTAIRKYQNHDTADMRTTMWLSYEYTKTQWFDNAGQCATVGISDEGMRTRKSGNQKTAERHIHEMLDSTGGYPVHADQGAPSGPINRASKHRPKLRTNNLAQSTEPASTEQSFLSRSTPRPSSRLLAAMYASTLCTPDWLSCVCRFHMLFHWHTRLWKQTSKYHLQHQIHWNHDVRTMKYCGRSERRQAMMTPNTQPIGRKWRQDIERMRLQRSLQAFVIVTTRQSQESEAVRP